MAGASAITRNDFMKLLNWLWLNVRRPEQAVARENGARPSGHALNQADGGHFLAGLRVQIALDGIQDAVDKLG